MNERTPRSQHTSVLSRYTVDIVNLNKKELYILVFMLYNLHTYYYTPLLLITVTIVAVLCTVSSVN